jgi:hypothetical protein
VIAEVSEDHLQIRTVKEARNQQKEAASLILSEQTPRYNPEDRTLRGNSNPTRQE